MTHGATSAKNMSDDTTTPPSDFFPALARWIQPHKPDAGRNASNTGLFSAAIPQSPPNTIHGLKPSRSSKVSAIQKITATNSAERLVSHTQRVHQYIT